MNFKVVIVTALALGALQPVAAFADSIPPEFQGRGCVFYTDANEQGPSDRVNVRDRVETNGNLSYAWYQRTVHPKRDNTISGVKCDHHCVAVLYDKQQLTNPELAIVDGQQGFVSFAGQYANDRTSSLSIFCAR